MSHKYVTHARTLDELRSEFLADLSRRISDLDTHIKHFAPTAAEASRIARAKIELEKALEFWHAVEIRSARRNTNTTGGTTP